MNQEIQLDFQVWYFPLDVVGGSVINKECCEVPFWSAYED